MSTTPPAPAALPAQSPAPQAPTGPVTAYLPQGGFARAVAARLAELGIELPSVVPPVAAYIPATVHGDLVYTSGQLPMVAGALPATGKVGGGVEASAAYGYARQCALNAIAAAAERKRRAELAAARGLVSRFLPGR